MVFNIFMILLLCISQNRMFVNIDCFKIAVSSTFHKTFRQPLKGEGVFAEDSLEDITNTALSLNSACFELQLRNHPPLLPLLLPVQFNTR